MTVPKPPDSEPTPPQGLHSKVNHDSMAERAIDKAHDAKKIAMHADDRSAEALTLSKRHADMIELLPGMKTALEIALRPTVQPRYVSRSIMAAAAALCVVAVCGIIVTTTLLIAKSASASAPVQSPSVQANR